MSQPLLIRSEMYTTSKLMGQYEETWLYLILEFLKKNWVQCTSTWLHTLILKFAGICFVLVLFNASCKITIFFNFLRKFSIFSQKQNSVCQWHLSHKLTVCKLTALTFDMFWLCGFIISPTSPICFVWSTLIGRAACCG